MPELQVPGPAVTYRETAGSGLVPDESRALSQCAMDQHHADGGRLIPPDAQAAGSVFMSTRAAGPFLLLLRNASRPILLALLAAFISVMATPTAAHAAFGVQSFTRTTLQSDNVTLFTQAGGHPFLGVTAFTIKTRRPDCPTAASRAAS